MPNPVLRPTRIQIKTLVSSNQNRCFTSKSQIDSIPNHQNLSREHWDFIIRMVSTYSGSKKFGNSQHPLWDSIKGIKIQQSISLCSLPFVNNVLENIQIENRR